MDLALLSNQNQIPPSLIDSLFVFLTGAASLRLLGNIKNYTYLLHTSFRQAQHTQAAIVISQFFTQLQGELGPNQTPSNRTMSGFMEAYNALQSTFGNDMPSFEDVISEVRNYILSTSISEVNASTGDGVDPNPTRRHTIYIGGAKIGRGVTIRNLLVTYYGRDAQKPQMDTVLQHARMYGYRQNELPAIRIYLPIHLARRFYDIHASDNAVREVCNQVGEPISVLPLSTSLNPTRRNVLNKMTVDQRAYVGGRQYFPRQPIAEPPILVNAQTQQLDELLSLSQYPQERTAYTISIDSALQILNFHFGTIGGLNGAWDDELIRTALAEIRNSSEFDDNISLVIISRASNISRSLTGLTRAIVPGNAGNPPYGVSRQRPALLMTKLLGSTSRNWYGHPFWVPVVRFPDGNYAFAANYS
ncbi:Z1 domain-containing protein [Leptolyngbya sp. KIOST-1]|uniref:Z1 domain-containing protein n=1 Tax=Leptolyngbya sp. KIOST-1 TaxID=1229172 RepID=UPI000907A799|nr:Z1 domain-containing protein [Leptolyngbya sp. KIOST-1]